MITMVNVVPFLYWLSTETLPFMDSTIRLVMFKPRPVPFLFNLALSFSFPKYLNNFARSFSLIPTPVSSISMQSYFFFLMAKPAAFFTLMGSIPETVSTARLLLRAVLAHGPPKLVSVIGGIYCFDA